MTIVHRISMLAALGVFLLAGVASPVRAEDGVQPPSGQEVNAAEASGDAAAAAEEPGCPFAGSGPCCAECQGKLAKGETGEEPASPPAGCPCQRARQLQLEKQRQQAE